MSEPPIGQVGTQVASPATSSHATVVTANNEPATANNKTGTANIKTALTPQVASTNPLGSRQLWQASPCLERCIALIEAACQATPGYEVSGIPPTDLLPTNSHPTARQLT